MKEGQGKLKGMRFALLISDPENLKDMRSMGAHQQRLLDIFRSEAEEHIQTLSSGINRLENNLPSEEKRKIIEVNFREIHSLKGASRAANLIPVEDLCEPLENIFEALKKNQLPLSNLLFQLLHNVIDALSDILPVLEQSDKISTSQESKLKRLEDLLNNFLSTFPKKNLPLLLSVNHETLPPQKVTHHSWDTELSKTVRINTVQLTSLLKQAEQILAIELETESLRKELDSIHDLIEGCKKDWISLQYEIDHASNLPKHFYPILEKLREHTRLLTLIQNEIIFIKENIKTQQKLIHLQLNKLITEMKATLQVPVSLLFDIFPLMVQNLCKSQNKSINLVTEGSDIKIDKKVFEGMKIPLLHLLRNSLDHGIETEEIRKKNGKPTTGLILLKASLQKDKNIDFIVEDDGAGINIQTIKEMALSQGLITYQEFKSISDQDAINLIFSSGFSTSPTLNEISGRGLGLAIVKEKIDELNGVVKVETKLGKFTRFQISVPLILLNSKERSTNLERGFNGKSD